MASYAEIFLFDDIIMSLAETILKDDYCNHDTKYSDWTLLRLLLLTWFNYAPLKFKNG